MPSRRQILYLRSFDPNFLHQYLHFVFKVIESSSAVPGWRKDLILEEEVKIPIVCNTFPKIFMVDFPGTSPSLHPKAEYEPDICRKRGWCSRQHQWGRPQRGSDHTLWQRKEVKRENKELKRENKELKRKNKALKEKEKKLKNCIQREERLNSELKRHNLAITMLSWLLPLEPCRWRAGQPSLRTWTDRICR